jgi:hypothetical protein
MAITIEGLGSQTRAYHNVIEGTSSAALILSQDATYVYIVDGYTYGEGADAVTPATEAMRAMIAAAAGEGLDVFREDGTSTGGAWDKLPPGDGVSPPGFTTGYDEQFYPEPQDDTSDGGVDFAQFEGARRAVARSYIGDTSMLASPEAAPVSTYYLAALVAEFGTPEHAAAALDPLYAQASESFVADSGITLEPVELDELGDLSRAATGTVEEDGVTLELSIILVQADAYLYLVVALGVGSGAGTLDASAAVIEAMMAAEAGSGDGTFDGAGGSTGGLWDKLPAAGDPALQGLTPESDEQVYPVETPTG